MTPLIPNTVIISPCPIPPPPSARPAPASRAPLTLRSARQQAEPAALSGGAARHPGHHAAVDHPAIGVDAPAETELGLALDRLPGARGRVALGDERDGLVELDRQLRLLPALLARRQDWPERAEQVSERSKVDEGGYKARSEDW